MKERQVAHHYNKLMIPWTCKHESYAHTLHTYIHIYIRLINIQEQNPIFPRVPNIIFVLFWLSVFPNSGEWGEKNIPNIQTHKNFYQICFNLLLPSVASWLQIFFIVNCFDPYNIISSCCWHENLDLRYVVTFFLSWYLHITRCHVVGEMPQWLIYHIITFVRIYV